MEKTLRVLLYARVSTHDQQALPMQLSAMGEYVERRGWTVNGSFRNQFGGKQREKNEELMRPARRREIDAVVVWRLDR